MCDSSEAAKKVEPERIVVALDTANGRIVTHGWRRKLKLRAEEVMPQARALLRGIPVHGRGPRRNDDRCQPEMVSPAPQGHAHPIIAAGGIKTRREIAALERIGMDAAVGMAMYKNRLR